MRPQRSGGADAARGEYAASRSCCRPAFPSRRTPSAQSTARALQIPVRPALVRVGAAGAADGVDAARSRRCHDALHRQLAASGAAARAAVGHVRPRRQRGHARHRVPGRPLPLRVFLPLADCRPRLRGLGGDAGSAAVDERGVCRLLPALEPRRSAAVAPRTRHPRRRPVTRLVLRPAADVGLLRPLRRHRRRLRRGRQQSGASTSAAPPACCPPCAAAASPGRWITRWPSSPPPRARPFRSRCR